MKRNTLHKILNPILAVFFLSQALTGLLHTHISYETYEVLHEGGGIILIFLVATHLTLNFNWVKASYFKKS